MKKLYKLSLVVLVPIITGIALCVGGYAAKNEQVLLIGFRVLQIGLPVTMFVLVVVGLILMITGRLFDDPPSNSDDGKNNTDGNKSSSRKSIKTREEEYSKINEVNSSHGYDSTLKSGEYMMEHTSNNYKHATDKEKVFGWLFFAFLIIDFALIPIFAFLGIMIGALVCFCLFAGTILLAGIIKFILEKTSMRVSKSKLKDAKIICGTVKACLLSSTSGYGGRYTTRISKVTYRVKIESDGKEYTAYTDKFFEEGESVNFAVTGKSRATITD